jgi:cytochrome c553
MKSQTGTGTLSQYLAMAALLLACASAFAEVAPVIPPQKFVYCTVCHGVDLKGNRNIEAPRLSGMEPWYVARQLEVFSRGWRGTHDADLPGIEMRPMAQALTAAEIQEVTRYVQAVKSEPPVPSVEGNAQRGAALYRSCATCHGQQAEGNESLGGPALTRQNDWYLVTQLRNYTSGIRGMSPGDTFGQQMRAAAQLLQDDDAIRDVVTYISTLQANRENPAMKKTALIATAMLAANAANADVTRYPLPNNSTFPIAQAVEVTADTVLIYHSGTVPGPANANADRDSREYYGNTETQALSVFKRMEESFAKLGVGFGDVIKMTVFLVGDPALGGKMDFQGFMNAYTKYFGTAEQPNKPARSAIQIAGLAGDGMLVEVEVVIARPKK